MRLRPWVLFHLFGLSALGLLLFFVAWVSFGTFVGRLFPGCFLVFSGREMVGGWDIEKEGERNGIDWAGHSSWWRRVDCDQWKFLKFYCHFALQYNSCASTFFLLCDVFHCIALSFCSTSKSKKRKKHSSHFLLLSSHFPKISKSLTVPFFHSQFSNLFPSRLY